jgi:hypothetical protein
LEHDFEWRREEMKRLDKDFARARKIDSVPVAEVDMWQMVRDAATAGLHIAERELEALQADMEPIALEGPLRWIPGIPTERLSPAAKAKIPGAQSKIRRYQRLLKALAEYRSDGEERQARDRR